VSHPVDIYVGQRLKLLRKLGKYSQTDLGTELGLSFQQVQKYESGTNRISASRLFELGQFFNVKADYFFDGLRNDDNPTKEELSDAALTAVISRIKDDKTKERILSFIEDFSSVSSNSRGD
jgi:transcriptional regulator with XRE-family HTH domain